MKSVKNIYKALVWAVLVIILCSISGDHLKKLPEVRIPHLDKMVHFVMYFVLAILLFSGFKQFKNRFFNKYAFITVTLLCVLYGGLIEIFQQTIFEGRSMDIYDFLANCTGTIVGVVLYPGIRRSGIIY